MSGELWQYIAFGPYLLLVAFVVVMLVGAGLLELYMWISRMLDYPWWLGRWPFMFGHQVAAGMPAARADMSGADVFMFAVIVALDAVTLPLQVLAFPIYLIVYSRIRHKRYKRAKIIAALKGPGFIVLATGDIVAIVNRDDPGRKVPNL